MEEIAQVYARSLFEVASERDLLDTIKEQLGQFADALHENRQLAVFFFSPYFSVEEKKSGLERLVEGGDPAFMNFLEALIERHRMPAIYRIRTDFEVLYDKTNKLLPVQVTSAVELDAETIESLGGGSVSRPATRSSSRARSTPRSSAGSCCASATSSSTRRSAPASNNFAEKSRRPKGALRICRSIQTRSPQS